MWSLGPTIAQYLDGVCASGLYEAKLGREEYATPGKHSEVATYCAGYKQTDLPEIAALSDHLIFNSPGQIARFRPLLDRLRAAGETRSEEHTSELQSLMRNSYAVLCLKKQN